MCGCEQFSAYEVVTNSLKDDTGIVYPVHIHRFNSYKLYRFGFLEGHCSVFVVARSFVLDGIHNRVPEWLCFTQLTGVLTDFFQHAEPGWFLDVLGPFTNRRKPVTHLVVIRRFRCEYDDAVAMLEYLDAHFRKKRCLFLFDKRFFAPRVWDAFKAAGFDDMGGSRFGVCGRFFPTRRRRVGVRMVE